MRRSLADVHYSPEPKTSDVKYFDYEGKPTTPDNAFKKVVYMFNEYGDCVGFRAVLNLQGPFARSLANC